jgi:hypothetical protein
MGRLVERDHAGFSGEDWTVFEWRVTVVCPMREVSAASGGESQGHHRREVYVWTDQPSAVDAYDEASRVLEGWPTGSRAVDVMSVAMYVPSHAAARSA